MKNLTQKLTMVLITCLLLVLVNVQKIHVAADSPPNETTRDIVLIVDTTTVMAYETGGASNSPDSPFDNPEFCNTTNSCQPFRAIKDSLLDYINLLSFPNDRVGIITLTSQTPGGSRNPMVVLPLSSDKTAVLDAINGLKVYQPPVCDWGDPASPSKGPCINYTSEDIFSGIMCPIYVMGNDLVSETGDEPGNPSTCTQTDIGTSLFLAYGLFPQEVSANSQKIIIPLIATRANASQGDLNFPDGYCPESTWLSSWCNDNDPATRHNPSDPNYDADDYARDMADLIATPNTCHGIKTFSLGIGANVLAFNGTAEKLLEYIALNAGGSSASHGMYYYVPSSVILSNVLELLSTSDFCPTISSIARASVSPTSASSVDFTVTFSEDVQNVDTGEFSLTKTGSITGESVVNVTSVSASVYTVTVNTGSGSGTIRLDIPDNVSIQDLSGNPLSGLPYTSGDSYIKTDVVTLRSTGANDGWILESTETSTTGGTMDSTATTLLLGDDASDQQYRGILHFDTSSLPDSAVITSAILQIRRHSTVGSNPFTILGALRADLRKVSFGTAALQLTDFRVTANKNNVATFSTTPVSNWYTGTLTAIGRYYINRTGSTQFKLYFTLDDNDDMGADFMRFFSGNSGAAARPRLVIQYYVP